MFGHSSGLLARKQRVISSFMANLKKNRGQRVVTPFHQQSVARENAVLTFLKNRNRIEKDATIVPKTAAKIEERMYQRSLDLRNSQVGANQLMGLQGLGDDEPLSMNSQHLPTVQESLLHDNEYEYARSSPPPSSYGSLMSRKIMGGQSWPTLPRSFELRSKILAELEHESNMSPSARIFADKVLFHINRNIKACPSHFRERIRFEELIISRVIASRRSTRLYIVWSTVTPSARLEIEPMLERLNQWIVAIIRMNIKTAPNLPLIMWVYDNGNLPSKLPKDLKRELRNSYADLRTSNKDRVKYLQSIDGLSHKMKDVPWFMPYLWSKENKMANRRAMGDDLKIMEQRKGGGVGNNTGKPNFVS